MFCGGAAVKHLLGYGRAFFFKGAQTKQFLTGVIHTALFALYIQISAEFL